MLTIFDEPLSEAHTTKYRTIIMEHTGSSNKTARQRKPVGPQELIQMHQHDGKRSTTEVEHENASCPQHLVRICTKAQQKAALRVSMEDDDTFTMFQWSDKAMDQNEKSIDFDKAMDQNEKSIQPPALRYQISREDDDMFTMFQWSDKVMDQNEKSIDCEREKYQKILRQDSLKKRTPISTGDIFEEEECGRLYDAARKRELQGYTALFGLHFRRVSNTFGASLLDRNQFSRLCPGSMSSTQEDDGGRFDGSISSIQENDGGRFDGSISSIGEDDRGRVDSSMSSIEEDDRGRVDSSMSSIEEDDRGRFGSMSSIEEDDP